MKPNRPPRGRKPHLLKRLALLSEQVRAIGANALRLSYDLARVKATLDGGRNPHSPRTRAERLKREARRA